MSPMRDTWLSETRSSYDTDASGYAEKVRGLLGEKPYLRASLALFAELVTRSTPLIWATVAVALEF